jgi:polyhydroxybutyrate depolymerase
VVGDVNGQQYIASLLLHGSSVTIPAGTIGLLTCTAESLPANYHWTDFAEVRASGAANLVVYEYTADFQNEQDRSIPSNMRWTGRTFSNGNHTILPSFVGGRTYYMKASTQFSVSCSTPDASSGSSSSSVQASHDEEVWMNFGGTRRRYVLHVPSSLAQNSATPLILVLHGGGGDLNSARRGFSFDAIGEREGVLVAYPEGTGSTVAIGPNLQHSGTWNAGLCCGEAVANNVDDVSFLNAVVDDVSARYSVNADRVYATGFSNGAMMTYRLACEASNRFAAIAPVAGQFVYLSLCNMARPVSIFHIHGTADRCAIYGGSSEQRMCGLCTTEYYQTVGLPVTPSPGFYCPPVETTVIQSQPSDMDIWRYFDRVKDNPSVTVYQQGSATCTSYTTPNALSTSEWVAQNPEVVLCKVDGMGHTWPDQPTARYDIPPCASTNQQLYDTYCVPWMNVAGPLNTDINAKEQIWNFFSRHKIEHP